MMTRFGVALATLALVCTLSVGAGIRDFGGAGDLVSIQWSGPAGAYKMVRQGDRVTASGTFRGKPVTGTVPLKGRLWDRGGGPIVRVGLGLTGMLSLLWSGLAWVDPKTGDQVRLLSTRGPGTSEALIVSEVQP